MPVELDDNPTGFFIFLFRKNHAIFLTFYGFLKIFSVETLVLQHLFVILHQLVSK